MAKGAAKEKQLGKLHEKVAAVFTKVLERYETRLDIIQRLEDGTLSMQNTGDTLGESLEQDEIASAMMQEIMNDGALPNPAMLSAITKFLKDNEIGFDTEQISELSATERRLAERRKARGNVVDLTTLPAAEGM